MAAPLAPTVQGPIVPSSTHVAVSGALEGATVMVVAAPNAETVGETIAGVNGGVLVPLFEQLAAGRLVFAKQRRTGETSPTSNVGVPVVDVPDPLPVVVFASPLTECMDRILLVGLVPGAVVTVMRGATTLGLTTATGTGAWVFIGGAGLSAGQTVTARQQIGAAQSPPSFSPPLASVDQKSRLAPPRISQPLAACDTGLLISDVVPAGRTELDVDGDVITWTNVAATYWGNGARLPRAGTYQARQVLPGCGVESEQVDVPVGPPVTPPAPSVQPFCPDARRIVVTGLRPSGVLHLLAREEGTTTETELGELGFSTGEQQVDLPEQIGGEGPRMHIEARQVRCGLTSPPGSGGEIARPGSGAIPPQPPRITEPLLACMRAVPATGLYNGVLTQVVSEQTGLPLGDPVVVASPTARLPVWFPLRAGDEVRVTQQGCSAPATSQTVTVAPLPSPLPTPKIRTPVRPGVRTVVVDGCLPGSRVLLLVDEVERAATDQTWTGQAVLEVAQPLAERARLFCVQRMCAHASDVEGPRVTVTKGRLTLEVTPASAPGGAAVSVLVRARDGDTGAEVPGLPVTLGGAPVGVTGTAFGWTAPTSGAGVSGSVAGGTAYASAGFSIPLRQAVPVNLTLTPGPTLVPGQVYQTDVTWTVTPEWGAAPVTVTGNTPLAMVPPPPGPGARVLVSLSLKAHLRGVIGGIEWPPDVIDISGPVAYVAMTKPTHALSALFSYGAQSVPIVNEEGVVTGYEDKLFAKVNLLGIS